MAVVPQLSDAEITSLLEIPHPSKAMGEAIYGCAPYFFGVGSLNCLATRGFPDVGSEIFPGMRRENNQLTKFIDEGAKVYACRLGLALHGAREEDLVEGVIPCHPLDMQDAMIAYSRKNAIINTTWMV